MSQSSSSMPVPPSQPTDPTVWAEVELAPSYRIPMGVMVLGLLPVAWPDLSEALGSEALGWVRWVGLVILAFGLFLAVQTATLRLRFTPTSLDVYRLGLPGFGATERQIRTFPYRQWIHWELWWKSVPILFYFREVNSIHFLPVLFAPSQLWTCLVERCPRDRA